MDTLRDIILSFMIGTILVLAVIENNLDLTESGCRNIMYTSTQQSSLLIKEIIESDLKRIGLGLAAGSEIFAVADSNSVRFWGDVDLDGTPEMVMYYAGDSASADYTENPSDVILYRQVDGGAAQNFTVGLIEMKFRYYDDGGNEVSVPEAIREIGYSLYFENPEGFNGVYPGTFISGKVRPKNIS